MTRLLVPLVLALPSGASAPGSGPAGPWRSRLTEVVVTLDAPPWPTRPRGAARLDAEQRAFREALAARAARTRRSRWRYRLVDERVRGRPPERAGSAPARAAGRARRVRPGELRAAARRVAAAARRARPLGAGPRHGGPGREDRRDRHRRRRGPPVLRPVRATRCRRASRGGSSGSRTRRSSSREPSPRPLRRRATAPLAFDGENSMHGTHVAGIAAGNPRTPARRRALSGIAPRAYIGNYKALVQTDSGLSPNGNAPELVAAIEAAVRDGMDVLNLSIGEPEIESRRDIVARALDAAAAAGRRAGRRGRERLRRARRRLDQLPGELRARDHGRARSRSEARRPRAVHAAVLLGRPDHDVAAPEAGRRRARGRHHLGRTGRLGVGRPARAWPRRTSPAPRPSSCSGIRPGRPPRSSPRSSLTGTDTRSGGDGPPGPGVPGRRARQPRACRPPAHLRRPEQRLARPRRPRRAEPRRGAAHGDRQRRGDVASDAQRPRVAHGGEARPPRFGRDPRLARVRGRHDGLGSRGRPQRLHRAAARRRGAAHPVLGSRRGTGPRAAQPRAPLARAGAYRGTTRGRPARVIRYRYPENPRKLGDHDRAPRPGARLSLPADAARRQLRRGGHRARPAGARVEPRVVTGLDENRLTGLRRAAGRAQPVPPGISGAAPRRRRALAAAGRLRHRLRQRDARRSGQVHVPVLDQRRKPPTLRLRTGLRRRRHARADLGAGTPGPASIADSIIAIVDGQTASPLVPPGGVVRIPTDGLAAGQHRLTLRVSDHQESKNTENVNRILPNTRTLTATFTVR